MVLQFVAFESSPRNDPFTDLRGGDVPGLSHNRQVFDDSGRLITFDDSSDRFVLFRILLAGLQLTCPDISTSDIPQTSFYSLPDLL